MSTRMKGPGAGFGWLNRGIRMIFRHPVPVLGGAGLVLLCMLVPIGLVQWYQFSALQSGRELDAFFLVEMMATSALLGLLVLPLYAGYLQMLDAADRGQPARAVDVFGPYRNLREAGRLIGYGLLNLVVYNLLVGALIVGTGGGLGHWYMQVLAAQAHHQPPPASLPHGFGISMALFMVLALFLAGFYAISLGQVALRQRNVFGAIGDGLLGALKNVLPLLVLALSALLVVIVMMLALLIVAIVIGLVGALAGSTVALILTVPLYVVMMLAMIAIMFGVNYQMWRDVCGEDPAPGGHPAIAA